jgi:hypothetical protein
MFITDRIHCLFGPVRGDFYYRKFICGFAVFFVTELRGVCDKIEILVVGAAQAGDYEVSTSMRDNG